MWLSFFGTSMKTNICLSAVARVKNFEVDGESRQPPASQENPDWSFYSFAGFLYVIFPNT